MVPNSYQDRYNAFGVPLSSSQTSPTALLEPFLEPQIYSYELGFSYFLSLIEGTDEYDERVAEDLAIKRDIYLDEQVEAIKDHIFSHVPFNLIDEVLDPILHGISEAIKV